MAQPSQPKAQVLSIDTPGLFAAAVQWAAELLKAGQLVALPTETVYGLAANALDAEAVARIFQVKGRPAHNPLIVHIADIAMARQCVSDWPAAAERLAQAFWPGPLTLVLPRNPAIPDAVTAGGATVGVRWPSHLFIQAVIRACGFPLAAPSANLSNRVSPTSARHTQKQLGDRVPLIVDGGQCQVGIESTVVDLSVQPPCVLRPGMIHREALASVIGPVALGRGPAAEVFKSPGLLRRHYAPQTRLVIRSWNDERELRLIAAALGAPQGRTCVIAHTRVPGGEGFRRVSVIPHDPEAFARAIYAELHACDEASAELIIVEALPQSGEWQAIGDRLKRASV